MAKPKATATEMAQTVVNEVVDALRKTLPRLPKDSDTAYLLEFTIHIRDGLVSLLEIDTCDDNFCEIRLVRPVTVDVGLKKIESGLYQGLQKHLISGFHGRAIVRVSFLKELVGVAFFTRKQRKYDWAW